VIRTTGRSGQTVALTFSSGPDPLYTPDILDILDAHGVKATFCILGTQAEEHPQLVEQIAAEGHVLCDHTMTYDYALAARDDATIRAEIEGGLSAIRAAVPGASVPFFRAPGGNFSAKLVDIAASFDQASLGWNVDPRDWETPGAAAIRASVVDAVQPGSIVVLHDEGPNRGGTVEALPGIIEDLIAEGYQFVTPVS
jgi:peptidoglycan/xylan/chitin deacetylase (PgdA/CDA1 family)